MDTLDSIEAVFGVVDNIDDNILEEVEVAEPRNPKVYFRDVDPFHDYSENCFKKRFRFSKSVLINVILPRITDSLQSETQRGLPVSPLCQLLTALRFYATGSFQVVCGDIMHISQSTICLILALLTPDFIKFSTEINTFLKKMYLGFIGYWCQLPYFIVILFISNNQRFWDPNVCFNFLDTFLIYVKRCIARKVNRKHGERALYNLQTLPLVSILFEWQPGMPVQVSEEYSHDDDPILSPWFLENYGKIKKIQS